MADIVIC